MFVAFQMKDPRGNTRIAVGFDDLVVLESNPWDDIGVYRDVLVVVNDGTIIVNRIQ